MESRFESTKSFLIDLLRAYGSRPIIVMIRPNGEEVEVMARTFVKRQLTAVGIPFPYNEKRKKCTRIPNSELDNEELCIIFHNAVFELEAAYVEEFCQGKPETEDLVSSIYGWIERKKMWIQYTFPYYSGERFEPFLEKRPEPELKKGELSVGLDVNEEDVKALEKMGYKQISSIHAMMQLFWTFASYRKPIEKMMKNAILSITVDEEAADYLNSYYKFYNSFIQAKIESNTLPCDPKKEKKHQGKLEELNRIHQTELKELSKKHRTELEERARKNKNAIAELNRNHQKELHEKTVKYKEDEAIIEHFRKLLMNPSSKINQTYDLTNEEDIRNFISWFRISHKKIRNHTIKDIVKERFDNNEVTAELFKRMVDDYNASLLDISD